MWMADDFDNLRLTPSSDFTIQSFEEVETARNELPPPALPPMTVVPEGLSGKGRYRLC